ncbi:MAG: class I SAM-dependent methyltransferase [Acidimicrobiales bacterium]|jgi:SAM-dependent methyltransferase
MTELGHAANAAGAGPPPFPGSWDEHAAWWKATFTGGADREYEVEIIPLVVRELAGCRVVVDIGCGEGQVARAVATAHGCRVVAVDPSGAQLANGAAVGDPKLAISYVHAEGEHLPLATGSVDGALCCLVIEHVADADALLAEAARVLAPGGTFLLVVNHPVFQGPGSGFVDDQILDERYWRVGPYLVEQWDVEEVDPKVSLAFNHRPLSRYVNPLAELDLVLVHLEEPAPRLELLADSVDPEFESTIPRLCAMRFEHRPRVAD